MATVTLVTPGAAANTLVTGATGNRYTSDVNGQIMVDARDVAPLLNTGFTYAQSGGGGGGSGTPRVISLGNAATLQPTDFTTMINLASPVPFALTMPAAPVAGTPYVISDYGNNAAANPITLLPNAGQTIKGSSVIASNGGARTLNWIPALNAYQVVA